MHKPPVLVLSHDAEEYLPLLAGQLGESTPLAAFASSREAVEGYRGQPVLLGEPDLIAAALDHLPDVRWVQSSWAGVEPLLGRGPGDYVLTCMKGVFGSQMSEYVFAYLLSRELKILERLGRQSEKAWWDQPSGTLRGKTMGVMGTGSIGSVIAARAKGFGMDVVGFSRSGRPAESFDTVYAGDRLVEFLPLPDYLVAVLPGTAATRHLLDARAFERMKDSCLLVNVGRGSLIDEQALVRALYEDQLAGAVLDVFESEPLAVDSPLWHAPNLLMTGHIAAISRPPDIAAVFGENYRKYCNDEPLDHVVDFERGY